MKKNILICMTLIHSVLLVSLKIDLAHAAATAGDLCISIGCVAAGGLPRYDQRGRCECWFSGAPGASCDTVCTGLGGCEDGGSDSWDDDASCNLGHALGFNGAACTEAAAAYLPAYRPGTNGNYYRSGGTSVTCAGANAAFTRYCSCKSGTEGGFIIISMEKLLNNILLIGQVVKESLPLYKFYQPSLDVAILSIKIGSVYLSGKKEPGTY